MTLVHVSKIEVQIINSKKNQSIVADSRLMRLDFDYFD